MLVVNLFGGPGSGKSTCAAGVFTLLKLSGVNAELVTEYAKDLTWEKRHVTLANQHYIFGKQLQRLKRRQTPRSQRTSRDVLRYGYVAGVERLLARYRRF